MNIIFDGKLAGGGLLAAGTASMQFIPHEIGWYVGVAFSIIGAIALGIRFERKKKP